MITLRMWHRYFRGVFVRSVSIAAAARRDGVDRPPDSIVRIAREAGDRVERIRKEMDRDRYDRPQRKGPSS